MIKNNSVEKFVERFGFEKCVFDLLKFIEKDNEKVKNTLIKKYLGESLSAEAEEEMIEYFVNNSIFSSATIANPATSVVTELLYKRPEVSHPIDKYFLASKSGKAIYSRLNCVEKNLHLLIEEYLKKKSDVLINNFGGGLSRDTIDVFSKYYQDNENIKAISIDRDSSAVKRGKRLAIINGVTDKTEFLEVNIMKYNPEEKFDIVLVVGVLCGMPPETCTMILKNIKGLLGEGGCVVASNASPKMLEEDSFTYFIMENILNWKLIFKDEKLLKDIFQKAGLKWQRSFADEYGFHNMGIGN